MRATVIYGERDVRLDEVPNPVLSTGGDAIVRVVAACVCGSDLWPYRGVTPTDEPHRIGHEFVGIVDEIGPDVTTITVGDFVIAPFYDCDNTCVNCRNGVSTSCLNGGWWGSDDQLGGFADGAQGERVRVPHADGSLVATPVQPTDDQVPGLLTLADVMGTGHHAAVSAGVTVGSTVVVVGDGAVGLCAIIAAKRLGASRIVAMSRHADRQAVAREFGATDIVEERGDAGVESILEMFDGVGADCVLECVGTEESMDQAIRSTRPGGMVGYVGVPNGGAELPIKALFGRNVGVNGGVASVRGYVEELLPEVLSGAINPGRVFDLQLPLSEVALAYAAMDERRAIKVLLRP
ncbi:MULTISPECIES: zinc-dependent alcohol dehydrogenase family protein [Cryobacterium]|uniref:zinc-dependent alcohol dehydrogenase family protein n=1 Tax=Cryobacterium TaxID=69578 RepID=UPI000B4DD25E|nr:MULTISPECIES: zinc-dependent alcohol dehydrogenase family protein [Cryobacterium]ASD23535.1 IMP dehydrogenase [Cryobacterium sp. LW097]POH63532.1 IMP dehydrogenase [Cryobacterium zongtaii]TFC42130.1 IMP dehydrogenase [Cryobacterium sp. TMN-39-2]TFC53733.1 IMP dehydrogenase [Cryobacterium sp. TMB3-1-2]TFC58937.1 IMP dehydrogenase [Cryobacterium sp. TMB1-7]